MSHRRNGIRAAARLALVAAGVFALLLPVAGCSIMGALASKGPAPKVRPGYNGLKGRTVGVMAWADTAIRNEHAALQLDIAEGLTQKLKAAQHPDAKIEELAGTKFPPERGPTALLAFQRNNPLYASAGMEEVAPTLGLERLIYVSVDDFTLHPEEVPELFRGNIVATVQVIEVEGGKGRIAYTDKVTASFPPGSPLGRPGIGEQQTYLGTVEAFTGEVLKKFITFEEGE